MKVGIIRCMQTEDFCSGTGDFKAIRNKTGVFADVAEDIEIWNTDSHPIFDANGNITNISKPINIGNHVWCGKGSKILKGVSIGDNAVIGMQALVTKDIVGGTLNVGIPAKSIKENINWDRHFIKC